MSIETVKITGKGKDYLIRLKQRTGVETWNVICRWGFCLSLSESSSPRTDRVFQGKSEIEMAWKTFGGEFSEVYLALIRQRCFSEGIELTEKNINEQFHLHIHRGLAYLMSNKKIQRIESLVELTPVGLL